MSLDLILNKEEVPLRKSQHSKLYRCPPAPAFLVHPLMFTGVGEVILYRGQTLSSSTPQASPCMFVVVSVYKLPPPLWLHFCTLLEEKEAHVFSGFEFNWKLHLSHHIDVK